MWLAPPLTQLCHSHIQIMHGGLFSEDGVTLDDIRKIERNRQPPDSGDQGGLSGSPFPSRAAASPAETGGPAPGGLHTLGKDSKAEPPCPLVAAPPSWGWAGEGAFVFTGSTYRSLICEFSCRAQRVTDKSGLLFRQ